MKKIAFIISSFVSCAVLGQGGQAFEATPSIIQQGLQERYLQVSVSNNLSLNDAYSIEAWVNIPSSSDGYLYVIESYAPTAGFGGYTLSISNGKIASTIFGTSSQTGFGNTTIAYDTWQHIAATYDGVDTLKLYLNGVLDGIFSMGIDNYNFGTDLYMGASGTAVENTENLIIDEVRIWEDVRTEQELVANMNTCLTGQESNLVLYYDFEQTPGVGFVTDQGPLGNHATIIHEQTNAFVTGVFSCCSIDNSIITTNETISATMSGASYQWIDCDNGNAPIQGETNQSFTASSNGNYAVIISDSNCIDTSDCVTINTIGLNSLENFAEVELYPNPATNELSILTSGTIEEFLIFDMYGALVEKGNSSVISSEDFRSGVYVIHIKTNEGFVRKRFLKE